MSQTLFTLEEAASKISVTKEALAQTLLAESVDIDFMAYCEWAEEFISIDSITYRPLIAGTSKEEVAGFKYPQRLRDLARSGMVMPNQSITIEMLKVPAKELDKIRDLMTGDFAHNEDYTSVRFKGQEFLFADIQADVIKFLHDRHKQGFKKTTQEEIAKQVKYRGIFRMDRIFRTKNSKGALHTLIVRHDTATWGLAID